MSVVFMKANAAFHPSEVKTTASLRLYHKCARLLFWKNRTAQPVRVQTHWFLYFFIPASFTVRPFS